MNTQATSLDTQICGEFYSAFWRLMGRAPTRLEVELLARASLVVADGWIVRMSVRDGLIHFDLFESLKTNNDK